MFEILEHKFYCTMIRPNKKKLVLLVTCQKKLSSVCRQSFFLCYGNEDLGHIVYWSLCIHVHMCYCIYRNTQTSLLFACWVFFSKKIVVC